MGIRGLSYINRGLYKEAREKYSKAIEVSPGISLYWLYRGIANSRLKDYTAAVEDFSKVLELDPTNYDGLARRCMSYLGMGQLEKARIDLAALRKGNPQSSVAHYLRALLCLALDGETQYHESCRAMLQQFQDTENPSDGYWVAWTCLLAPESLDDYGPVVRLAERAVEADPHSDNYLKTLGGIFYRVGRFDEAVERLNEANTLRQDSGVESKSSPAYAWFFLAMAHHKLGHDAEAEKWLAKATEWTDKVLKEDEEGTTAIPWNRRLTLELFRKEAEELLGKTAAAERDSVHRNARPTNRGGKERPLIHTTKSNKKNARRGPRRQSQPSPGKTSPARLALRASGKMAVFIIRQEPESSLPQMGERRNLE